MIRLTTEEYRHHENNFDGFCTKCGDVQCGGVEGDAEDYPCEACDEDAVCGMGTLLVNGLIEITG